MDRGALGHEVRENASAHRPLQSIQLVSASDRARAIALSQPKLRNSVVTPETLSPTRRVRFSEDALIPIMRAHNRGKSAVLAPSETGKAKVVTRKLA